MSNKGSIGKAHVLGKKAVFMALAVVNDANPNGDPASGNMPRTTVDGFGKMSPVCIKRKLRNRLQDLGHDIFIVADGRYDDGINNIYDRVMDNPDVNAAITNGDNDAARRALLENFIDCRAFGAVIAAKGSGKGKGISIDVRGAVTIQGAVTLEPIVICEDQIAKSVNGSGRDGLSSDRLGSRYTVEHGLYIIKGTVNPFYAKQNGFTEDDLEAIRTALASLFENDESAARPAGSMVMAKVIWWEGNITNNGISRLYDSVSIRVKDGVMRPESIEDYEVTVDPGTGAEVTDCA